MNGSDEQEDPVTTSWEDIVLTAGGVNGVSQFSVLPLAQVVLLHPSCHLVGLHLRTPVIA